MRRWLIGIALLGTVHGAGAGSWTCGPYKTALLSSAYLVITTCYGSGTYTTGGDSFAAGDNADLCGSAQKYLATTVLSVAGNPATVTGFVAIWAQGPGKLLLTTTGTGRDAPLLEVSAGTAIDGYRFHAVSFCE